MFKLGEVEAKIQQQHSVPGWVGGIALGAGLVFIELGLKKRSGVGSIKCLCALAEG